MEIPKKKKKRSISNNRSFLAFIKLFLIDGYYRAGTYLFVNLALTK